MVDFDSQLIADFILLLFGLFLLVCLIIIPILVIRLLINLNKKYDKKDCSNCPLYQQNNICEK